MKSTIKGIIYDLDDLMVNSAPLHVESWEILLRGLGHSFNAIPKETALNFFGRRTSDFLKAVIQDLKLEEKEEDLSRKKAQIFLNLVKEKLEPLPGLFQSITLFRENGFKLAIGSSGTKEYIDLALSKLGLEDVFDAVVSGDDVKIGKPDPETYTVACRELSLQPEECLVLEDATPGIESAKGAGCRCVAVRNPNTPPQDLSKADCVVDSLDEISLKTVK